MVYRLIFLIIIFYYSHCCWNRKQSNSSCPPHHPPLLKEAKYWSPRQQGLPLQQSRMKGLCFQKPFHKQLNCLERAMGSGPGRREAGEVAGPWGRRAWSPVRKAVDGLCRCLGGPGGENAPDQWLGFHSAFSASFTLALPLTTSSCTLWTTVEKAPFSENVPRFPWFLHKDHPGFHKVAWEGDRMYWMVISQRKMTEANLDIQQLSCSWWIPSGFKGTM